MLNDVLGRFDLSEMDINDWQADYWVNNEKYAVSGSMYYGTATVTLR